MQQNDTIKICVGSCHPFFFIFLIIAYLLIYICSSYLFVLPLFPLSPIFPFPFSLVVMFYKYVVYERLCFYSFCSYTLFLYFVFIFPFYSLIIFPFFFYFFLFCFLFSFSLSIFIIVFYQCHADRREAFPPLGGAGGGCTPHTFSPPLGGWGGLLSLQTL